jgi:hypothetical protein
MNSLDKLIDNFLEIYFGKYGRPDQFPPSNLDLVKYEDATAYMELSGYIDWLNSGIPVLITNTILTSLEFGYKTLNFINTR